MSSKPLTNASLWALGNNSSFTGIHRQLQKIFLRIWQSFNVNFLPNLHFHCRMLLQGTLGEYFDIFAASSESTAWVLLWKTRSRPIGVRVCPVAQFNFFRTAFDPRAWTMVMEYSGCQLLTPENAKGDETSSPSPPHFILLWSWRSFCSEVVDLLLNRQIRQISLDFHQDCFQLHHLLVAREQESWIHRVNGHVRDHRFPWAMVMMINHHKERQRQRSRPRERASPHAQAPQVPQAQPMINQEPVKVPDEDPTIVNPSSSTGLSPPLEQRSRSRRQPRFRSRERTPQRTPPHTPSHSGQQPQPVAPPPGEHQIQPLASPGTYEEGLGNRGTTEPRVTDQRHHRIRKFHRNKRERQSWQKCRTGVIYQVPKTTSLWIQTNTMKNPKMNLEPLLPLNSQFARTGCQCNFWWRRQWEKQREKCTKSGLWKNSALSRSLCPDKWWTLDSDAGNTQVCSRSRIILSCDHGRRKTAGYLRSDHFSECAAVTVTWYCNWWSQKLPIQRTKQNEQSDQRHVWNAVWPPAGRQQEQGPKWDLVHERKHQLKKYEGYYEQCAEAKHLEYKP